MDLEDREYFERRAETQLELARAAQLSEAVQAHYSLACAYLDRIYPPEEMAATALD